MSCPVCKGYDSHNCPVCSGIHEVCPACQGTGQGPYMAFDTELRIDIPVTREEYFSLPADEDDAFLKGERYCQQDREECACCRGTGVIW